MGETWQWTWLCVALSLTPSCTTAVFQCSDTEDCAGRPGGVCESTGYCSFPDDECPSGRRYGEFSQGSLSGACVTPDDGTSTTTRGSDSMSSIPSTLSDSGSGTSSSSGVATTTDSASTTAGVDPSDTAADSSSTGADDDSSSSSGSDGGSSSEGSSSTSTGPAPEVIEIISTLAACTDPINNDPAACEQSTLTQGMSVDAVNNGAMNAATTAFVAFEFDDELAGEILASAEVRLTATDEANAESTTQSGELWLSEAFSLASLAVAQPSLLGKGPIAPDQGGVMTSEEITWTLEPSDVDLGATLYIAVVPTTPEGVDYWNSEGTHPPVLRLVLAP